MIYLNVEEMYLLKTLDCSDRYSALKSLTQIINETQDDELLEQYSRLSGKLSAMGDAQFRDIDLKLYGEEQRR